MNFYDFSCFFFGVELMEWIKVGWYSVIFFENVWLVQRIH